MAPELWLQVDAAGVATGPDECYPPPRAALPIGAEVTDDDGIPCHPVAPFPVTPAISSPPDQARGTRATSVPAVPEPARGAIRW